MRVILTILLSLSLAGCATNIVYNPMQVASQQELLLNEGGFKAVQDGMTMTQVHQAMGTALLIGYKFQDPDYKPLTIPNPYRSEEIKGTGYIIEYYIQAISQPDDKISDNELMPFIFKDGKLIGRGWPLANSLRPSKPSA
jgi:hypothetical protein